MDKLIDYEGLGTFQTNILNDNKISPIATWSSEKITDELSGKANTSDLSSYATISYVTNGLAGKQNTLTAGTNISISNNVISASAKADGYVWDTAKHSFAIKYLQNGSSRTNTATGRNSFASGSNTTASGWDSHAEGDSTTASGENSHAEGLGTTASGLHSHAEGVQTNATGHYSHAGGYHTEAQGLDSFTEGAFTIAKNEGEYAGGISNISHKEADYNHLSSTKIAGNTQYSIGIGWNHNNTENHPKNALEVMQNGDYYLYGVGNYDGVHIKNEQGAPANLQTLQEVIAALEARIAALENPNA